MKEINEPSSAGALASVTTDVITVSSEEFMVAVNELKKVTEMSDQVLM
jgi:hypothetical protein